MSAKSRRRFAVAARHAGITRHLSPSGWCEWGYVPLAARVTPASQGMTRQFRLKRPAEWTRFTPDDLAELEETLDVLSDPRALADIREAGLAYTADNLSRRADAVRNLRR